MIKRILLIAFVALLSFRVMAQDMTLEEVRARITYSQQELNRLLQIDPRTPEIDQQIITLKQKIEFLRRTETSLKNASQPVEQKPVVTAPASTSSSSNSQSNTSPQNISETPGAASTGDSSSLSDTLSQPTVMAAMISAAAVIATTLLGIFAKRK